MFYHIKGRGYNKDRVLYPRHLRWTYFCCFIFVTLLWALHAVIKQQFLHLLKRKIDEKSVIDHTSTACYYVLTKLNNCIND